MLKIPIAVSGIRGMGFLMKYHMEGGGNLPPKLSSLFIKVRIFMLTTWWCSCVIWISDLTHGWVYQVPQNPGISFWGRVQIEALYQPALKLWILHCHPCSNMEICFWAFCADSQVWFLKMHCSFAVPNSWQRRVWGSCQVFKILKGQTAFARNISNTKTHLTWEHWS